MKKFLLCLCLIPALSWAEGETDETPRPPQKRAIKVSPASPRAQLQSNSDVVYQTHPYLGVYKSTFHLNDLLREQLKIEHGVILGTVVKHQAADKAGLKRNDIIIQVDETPIKTFEALRLTVEKKNPGDTIKVTYLRAGKTLTTQVTLGSIKRIKPVKPVTQDKLDSELEKKYRLASERILQQNGIPVTPDNPVSPIEQLRRQLEGATGNKVVSGNENDEPDSKPSDETSDEGKNDKSEDEVNYIVRLTRQTSLGRVIVVDRDGHITVTLIDKDNKTLANRLSAETAKDKFGAWGKEIDFLIKKLPNIDEQSVKNSSKQ